jgi:rhodanese-related sulfurtransferase
MIIDLRTYAEARRKPVNGAKVLNIPKPPLSPNQIGAMAQSLYNATKGLRKDSPIFVLCAKGVRSGLAHVILRQAGFTRVTDLGGIS